MNPKDPSNNISIRDSIAKDMAIALYSNDKLRDLYFKMAHKMKNVPNKKGANLICEAAYEFADALIMESNLNESQSD